MPLQNRVLPTGEIVAETFRGAFTGNRGILMFDGDGSLGTSRWKHQHWIICDLSHPRGRYHGPQPARGWTPLFFSDEAAGLAAGHRPCAYCRRAAYDAWRVAWEKAYGNWPGHKEADQVLHRARVKRNRMQVRFEMTVDALPDGAFILWQNRPHLLMSDQIYPWDKGRYGLPIARPSEAVTVLTPEPTIAVLASGFDPDIRL